MGFWPTGPLTMSFAVIILSMAAGFLLWGDRSQRFIALAFIVSWVGARTATVIENQWVYVAFLTSSASLSFAGITLISRLIAILYAMRIVLVAGLQVQLFNWSILWELNYVFLVLQLLLAAGSVGGGKFRYVAGNSDFVGRPDNSGVLQMARRYIQRPFKRDL